MSFFDQASLVMIPSGYKTSKVYSIKPTDGSGDLAFTRSNDTATRVGPDGLIEKVRTNLLTYSNTFSNAAWIKTDSSVTSGQSGYDGTNNAWLLANTASSGNLTQAISFSGFNTLSFYAKAGTHQNLFILFNGSGFNATASYNLSTGVISNASADALITTATSVGNGWWRLTITGSRSNVDVRFYPSNNNTGGATTNGNILIQNIQLEAGDIATPYIATTSAAVSVGPVANVPRLDYLNSSCPRLLLEPQRTNVMLYSEQLNNAAWDNPNQVTITANAGVSPDGYANADRLLSTGSSWFLAQQKELTNGTSYVLSVYVKSNTSGNQTFRLVANGNITSSNFTATTSWQRFTLSFTGDTGLLSHGIVRDTNNSSADLLVWGAQIEAGAYATSYIPTLGAAVTRGADAALKTSISSLIGQDEGTIFVEFEYNYSDSTTQVLFKANQTTDANSVGIEVQGTTIKGLVNSGGGNIATITGTIATGTIKAALAYKTNDMAFYVNGTQVGVDTSGSIAFAGVVDILTIGQFLLNGGTFFPASRPFNQALVFKTRLSNSDLAALTA